jgi:hypothetical protein
MKTVYEVLAEMLGEEQGRLILASLARDEAEKAKSKKRLSALAYVVSILTVEEAEKMV